jgi:DMSO/TMAO reductase YedYZ molybdopterin-dependent catalytic subunit
MNEELLRRDFLVGGATTAGITLISGTGFAQTSSVEKVVPWADQPAAVPAAAAAIKAQTPWEQLDGWITPNEKFFAIAHYNVPTLDERNWRLDVTGLVAKPLTLTIKDLKALPRREIISTIECSGNNGLPFLTSAVGNAKWGGASLAQILKSAQIKPGAIEVVFFGADQGEEILRKGTPLELKTASNFGRSMSVEDATKQENLVAYEMNGSPLPVANGFPARLITPGWYGVANVKWLRRIEVRDTRFMGRFMGRDYVTVREEQRDGETTTVETSVGKLLLKSAPGRVTQRNGRYRIAGMAWGPAPIAAVEVKIDNEPWKKAVLDTNASPFAWRFWHLDWSPSPGEHTVTSRAIDRAGNMQPAADDASIVNKKTYWESNGQITRRVLIT